MKKTEGGLGVDRLVYDADIYDGMNTFAHDVPFYPGECRRAGGGRFVFCIFNPNIVHFGFDEADLRVQIVAEGVCL